MKFQITRTDINKVVLKPMEFADEAKALGEYVSALMLVGILKMRDDVATSLGNGCYRLANGWMIMVEEI